MASRRTLGFGGLALLLAASSCAVVSGLSKYDEVETDVGGAGDGSVADVVSPSDVVLPPADGARADGARADGGAEAEAAAPVVCTRDQDCPGYADGGASHIRCCNDVCADIEADPKNCSACGKACNVPSGVAACCAGGCMDVGADTSNCGGCGVVCAPQHADRAECSAGKCDYGSCVGSFGDCDGNHANGCESDIQGGAGSCGGCGNACSTTNVQAPTCGAGTCNGACNTGFDDCDNNKLTNGCEVDLNTDPAHCGTCLLACSRQHVPTPTCSASQCNGACENGWQDCNRDKQSDGCETDVSDDPANCGGCGTGCSQTNIARACSGGNCSGMCAPGYADCNNDKRTDGCETHTDTDSANCGGCGAAFQCAIGSPCVGGQCVPNYTVTASPQGFLNACTAGVAVAGLTNPFLTAIDDGTTGVVSLPFAFSFYRAAQTEFWVSSNGAIGFGATTNSTLSFPCPLPAANDYSPAIYVFGNDLVDTNGVCASVVGNAPNRQLVVTWNSARPYSETTGTLLFSAILTETTNTIDLVFSSMTNTSGTPSTVDEGAGAAVGVVGPNAGIAAQYSCDAANILSGTAVRFSP